MVQTPALRQYGISSSGEGHSQRNKCDLIIGREMNIYNSIITKITIVNINCMPTVYQTTTQYQA